MQGGQDQDHGTGLLYPFTSCWGCDKNPIFQKLLPALFFPSRPLLSRVSSSKNVIFVRAVIHHEGFKHPLPLSRSPDFPPPAPWVQLNIEKPNAQNPMVPLTERAVWPALRCTSALVVIQWTSCSKSEVQDLFQGSLWQRQRKVAVF